MIGAKNVCRLLHLHLQLKYSSRSIHLITSRSYILHLGDDGRSGASGREEEVHYSSLGIVRDTEARVSPVRIPSVEGCARYDDYRASWTRLIPTTRRLREDAPRARFFPRSLCKFSHAPHRRAIIRPFLRIPLRISAG